MKARTTFVLFCLKAEVLSFDILTILTYCFEYVQIFNKKILIMNNNFVKIIKNAGSF